MGEWQQACISGSLPLFSASPHRVCKTTAFFYVLSILALAISAESGSASGGGGVDVGSGTAAWDADHAGRAAWAGVVARGADVKLGDMLRYATIG